MSITGTRRLSIHTCLNQRFPSLIAECPRRYRAPKVRERVVNMQLAIPDWNPDLSTNGPRADQVSELGVY